MFIANKIAVGMPIMSSVAAPFSIANSFLLDGVEERFDVAIAGINPLLSGSNKNWTLDFGFRPQALGVTQYLLGDDSANIAVRITTGNVIQVILRDSAFKTALSTTALGTASFYWVRIVYDYSLSLGSRTKIYLDSSDDTASDTTTTTIDAGTGTFNICAKNSAEEFTGYFQQMGILDFSATSGQTTTDYGAGKPLSPITQHGASSVLFLQADNSGATAQFTITDSVNSITALSVNLEDADKTTVTPY